MVPYQLSEAHVRAGIWQALLQGPEGPPPELAVSCGAHRVQGLSVHPCGAGRWRLAVPVPVELLAEGVQSYLVTLPASGEVLGHFSIMVTGEAADMKAEVALLRAELDQLRRAFRHYCRARE